MNEKTVFFARKDFYEMCVESLNFEDFARIFGVDPVDIMDFDYDFDRDVTWNMNLEYAYNEFMDGYED